MGSATLHSDGSGQPKKAESEASWWSVTPTPQMTEAHVPQARCQLPMVPAAGMVALDTQGSVSACLGTLSAHQKASRSPVVVKLTSP